VHRVDELVRERGVETAASVEDYRRCEELISPGRGIRPVPQSYLCRGKRRRLERSSRIPGAVAEVDHAIAETAFVQQFELQADAVGQGPLAASHHHRCYE
jgi:hypothetical protein